jgi:hypothetical protein
MVANPYHRLGASVTTAESCFMNYIYLISLKKYIKIIILNYSDQAKIKRTLTFDFVGCRELGGQSLSGTALIQKPISGFGILSSVFRFYELDYIFVLKHHFNCS